MNTQANRPDDYQVIVSNVGTVYTGNMASEARADYEDYKHRSEQALGAAAGEDVTLMYHGEPLNEYIGVLSAGREEATPTDTVCDCPVCLMGRTTIAILSGKKESLSTDDVISVLARATVAKARRIPNVSIYDEESLVNAIVHAIRAHVTKA